MLKVYTIAQFRQHTRKVLNEVDLGVDVCIRRYDTIYRITKCAQETKPFVGEGVANKKLKNSMD